MQDRTVVLLSGYAKLPTNTTAESVYETLVVAVLFDKRSGTIIEAEASMVTELAKSYVSKMLVGYNLNAGPDEIIECMEECYHGTAKRALETAIRMIFSRYQDYCAQHRQDA